jgi:Ca2+:H+ antiporter
MTSATTSGQGKQKEGDSEETAVERESTRVPSEETKARRRFLSRFKGGRSESHDSEYTEKPKKKRAWYKGKILKHKPFTVRNQLGATIFNSWINILLLCAPIGIALNYAGVDKKAVFVVNFIAIIPLAGMLSFATEEIALHVGESLGGLLNASFG